MGFYKNTDKKSGNGLAITEWNDLSNAVAGNSGLTLAINPEDKVVIGTPQGDSNAKLTVQGDVNIGGTGNALLNVRNIDGKDPQSNNKDHLYLNWNTGKHVYVGKTNKKKKSNLLVSGNVGIGTESPSAKLEVNGDVKATKFIGDGSQLTNLSVGATGLNLATTRGSKVGIGTNDPSAKLEVDGDLKVSNNGEVANVFLGEVGFSELGFGDWAGFSHKSAVGTKSYGLLQNLDGTCTLINKKSGSGFIGFRIDNEDKMILFDNGNVGIGIANTETPSAKLEVSGDLKVSGQIEGKIWYSNEYTWEQGQPPVRMGPVDTTVAFLTCVRGQFEGHGEMVEIVQRSGYWYLEGNSEKKDVMAKARCIGKPY